MVTTVVSNATLDAHHFYLNVEDLPRGIYMTENGNAKEYGITAISQITSDGVYKIFSSKPLNETTLEIYSSQVMRLFTSRFGVGCMEVLLLTTKAKER